MKFKVGDVVVVHKPLNVDEHPCWVIDMDMFEGKEAKVIETVDHPVVALIRLDIGKNYIFNPRWCTLVDDFLGNV